jgi:Ser/Thr protein kinase RdoA (MazF antagonist)
MYALRIAAPNRRTMDDLRSETLWLEAPSEDTDTCPPRVVRTGGGSRFVEVEAHGVPGSHLALLMSWLPGRLLTRRLGTASDAAMG